MAQPRESLQKRSQFYSYVLLAVTTAACLIPFSGKAFNVDDTLFVYVARQITQHPLDPFGFQVNWFTEPLPMAYETKNPPFASYYIAAAASLAGWSERALHLAFLLPAIGVVFGTYRLAQRFTRSSLLAAFATLFAPAFLVSANSVMCDTMMLALWLWAIIFWLKGFEPQKPVYLIASVFLITLCALTKYYGAALILLLAAYSLARQRRFGGWAWYLLLPILLLTGYQHWTKAVYGVRMISSAAHFSTGMRKSRDASILAKTLVDLSFVGGCALPVLILAPLFWKSRKLVVWWFLSAVAAFLIGTRRIALGDALGPVDFYQHPLRLGLHLTCFIAAGGSVLALATLDLYRRRDPESLLLAAWVFGTFLFTGFVNWDINARSVLPMIPAAAILLARRWETEQKGVRRGRLATLVFLLAVAGGISLWLTAADTELANSSRTAATLIAQKTKNQPGTVWFFGHWGFQYYMESFGAHAVLIDDPPHQSGDYVVEVENNVRILETRPEFVASRDVIRIPVNLGITTISNQLGTGFYSSELGPLPFAFGGVPPERYALLKLGRKAAP